MRRILLGAALVAILAGTGNVAGLVAPQAMAQGAGGLFRPVVYVNDSAVTAYEIDQRLRFMQMLRAPNADRASVEKILIDDRLKSFAARQAGITASEEQIGAGLEEFAARGGLSVEEFTQLLGRNGIDRQTFEDFVASGIEWREFVRARVVGMVAVSDAEVDQQMQDIIETPEITHVSLSELIIPAPPGQEGEAMALAERIVAQTASEADFAAFARQYSATPSGQQGGRLPMMPLANLPPTLRPVLLQMTPGQVSQPFAVEGAVVLFFLRDTRGTLRPGATEQQLDFMRVRLASAEEAARLATDLDNCDMLEVRTGNLPLAQVQRQTLSQGQIPSGEALRLASLDENETAILSLGGATTLLMLCKRSPALLANAPEAPVATSPDDPPRPADALPIRSDVRDQIFNGKIAAAAENYLADLRANAIIRRP
ncbi:peptidylprolyl isomerase [Paracoccus ravus]|uniref:peptidylprolyl isomerase n=1 Tax=Paracoccus ravus TaxID=2447760 RepID=UPI00106E4E21|nr:peptidylprolyl isomerase [Paracoccus ravus]